MIDLIIKEKNGQIEFTGKSTSSVIRFINKKHSYVFEVSK